MSNDWFQKAAIQLVITLVLFTVFKQFGKPCTQEGVTYSQFMDDAETGRVRRVEVQGRTLLVTPNEGDKYSIVSPSDIWMVGDLMKYGVQVTGKAEEEQDVLLTVLYYLGPTLLIIMFQFYMIRQMQGSGKDGAFSFGKSRARLVNENNNSITFTDVADRGESREEVVELVDFLKDPRKFQKPGGRIPHSVLLMGPPGTGKTLLAHAIADEAKIPFFSIPSSGFVEMLVGVGVARVYNMSEGAKKQVPCIVLIGEIDTVGRHRGADMDGGSDGREQTLNRMSVKMDGFEANSGVIVVTATNRADVLDKVLLRPGRSDRQVYVGLPDVRDREQILKVHMHKIPIGNDVDASVLARSTPGFSGTDLANLVNEVVLFATRHDKHVMDIQNSGDARSRIYMGPERKSAVIREEERRVTVYHESGHAAVAKLLPKANPVHKVMIMPRGWAGGLIWQLPEHDKHYTYEDTMLEEVAILFGGRVAGEIFLDAMGTGASNDFGRATKMAHDMVTHYGVDGTLGTMVYVDTEQDSSLGRMASKAVSEVTQQKVDSEIRRIVDGQYALAKGLLEANRDKMETTTAALLEWETIDADQVSDIVDGKPPRPLRYGSTGGGSIPPDGGTPAGVNPGNVPAAA